VAPVTTFDIGEPASTNVVYAPAEITRDGAGLPAGRGSVAQGEAVYSSRCANCHDTPAFPTLWGGAGSLARIPQKTVGSYWPYATTLYDYISRAMPPAAPHPLTPDQTYALTAFILSRNGIVKQTTTLDAKSLPAVRMPNRDGFFSDGDRPDT